MRKPSDAEYALMRQVRELKEKVSHLEDQILQLKKQLEKAAPVEAVKKGKKPTKLQDCPSCGAGIKVTTLPFGKLQLCANSCGWRNVVKS